METDTKQNLQRGLSYSECADITALDTAALTNLYEFLQEVRDNSFLLEDAIGTAALELERRENEE